MERCDNLLEAPAKSRRVTLGDGEKPRFWVTIDTEEDFDWTAPFSRDDYRLDSVPALAECQRYFAAAGVAPAYLVDWPIVQDDSAVDILGEALADGKCEVGAQLHPWVTPPHTEVISTRNSYTGNLPVALQREKMTILRNGIAERFGVAPISYRAGRYGLGAETAQMLIELGYRCDTSVRSGFDYRPGHGPDYLSAPLEPWWVQAGAGDLLEVPVTTVFGGLFRGMGRSLYRHSSSGQHAILARLGLVERIALTPEGIPAAKACRAIDIALAARLPILTFSFHSPSLAPGNTPYVRSDDDLKTFYRWWDIVLGHLAKLGIAPTTSAEIVAMAEQQRAKG